MPMEMGMKLLASEAAILRYLKVHSDIPVPEVYNYWYQVLSDHNYIPNLS